MGEIKSDGESLMRNLGEIIKGLTDQRDKLQNLVLGIKSLVEKAEKTEEEKQKLEKELEEKNKQFMKEKSEILGQK